MTADVRRSTTAARTARCLAAGALALLVAGCAGLAPVAPRPDDVLGGRLVVVAPPRAEGAAPQNLASAFELQGDGAAGELRLITPLGTQLAAARWSPGQATLVDSAGTRSFADLDALSLHAFGQALPLRALPDWLRGRPWSGAASVPIEGGFEQAGWRVQTARRAEGLLLAERALPTPLSVRVRLEAPAP